MLVHDRGQVSRSACRMDSRRWVFARTRCRGLASDPERAEALARLRPQRPGSSRGLGGRPWRRSTWVVASCRRRRRQRAGRASGFDTKSPRSRSRSATPDLLGWLQAEPLDRVGDQHATGRPRERWDLNQHESEVDPWGRGHRRAREGPVVSGTVARSSAARRTCWPRYGGAFGRFLRREGLRWK